MRHLPIVRQLLAAARTANETASRHALIDAALQLLEGSTTPGTGSAAIPPTGPGVPGVAGPSSGLTPPIACPHPANQRQALGGFGGDGTAGSFQCRACGARVGG